MSSMLDPRRIWRTLNDEQQPKARIEERIESTNPIVSTLFWDLKIGIGFANESSIGKVFSWALESDILSWFTYYLRKWFDSKQPICSAVIKRVPAGLLEFGFEIGWDIFAPFEVTKSLRWKVVSPSGCGPEMVKNANEDSTVVVNMADIYFDGLWFLKTKFCDKSCCKFRTAFVFPFLIRVENLMGHTLFRFFREGSTHRQRLHRR